jgi:hypothetical protein
MSNTQLQPGPGTAPGAPNADTSQLAALLCSLAFLAARLAEHQVHKSAPELFHLRWQRILDVVREIDRELPPVPNAEPTFAPPRGLRTEDGSTFEALPEDERKRRLYHGLPLAANPGPYHRLLKSWETVKPYDEAWSPMNWWTECSEEFHHHQPPVEWIGLIRRRVDPSFNPSFYLDQETDQETVSRNPKTCLSEPTQQNQARVALETALHERAVVERRKHAPAFLPLDHERSGLEEQIEAKLNQAAQALRDSSQQVVPHLESTLKTFADRAAQHPEHNAIAESEELGTAEYRAQLDAVDRFSADYTSYAHSRRH